MADVIYDETPEEVEEMSEAAVREFLDRFCENFRHCRSKFDPTDRECMECYGITTFMEEKGRDSEEVNKALEAWASR